MSSYAVTRPQTTRTTRTPAFWGYPPPPHDYPYHWVILDPKSKEDKVKVTNLKKSPKFQIWNGSDEYSWRYRADTILSTDGQTDRQTDGQGDTSIPPYQLRWSGGYNELLLWHWVNAAMPQLWLTYLKSTSIKTATTCRCNQQSSNAPVLINISSARISSLPLSLTWDTFILEPIRTWSVFKLIGTYLRFPCLAQQSCGEDGDFNSLYITYRICTPCKKCTDMRLWLMTSTHFPYWNII